MRCDDAYNLAIETASGRGVIALGRGDTPLTQAPLPQRRRHNVELIPAIARLCREHGIGAGDLAEAYVSLGPGSFTGLRIAVATVKMLALTTELRVVGVPTLEALQAAYPGAVVCLHVKRGTAWSAGPGMDPALRPVDELRATGLPIVGQKIDGATEPAFAVEPVWRIGRRRAAAGPPADPLTLSPLYIREPEAVTLWNQREQNSRTTEQQNM